MLRDSTGKSVNCCVALGQAPGLRRRALLKSGASVRALRVLLAVPVAVTVGVALSRPAHAGSTLPSSSSEVSLGSVNYTSSFNPFTLNSGTLISSSAVFALYGNNTAAWTVTNHGTISATSSDPAVEFAAGGVIHNYGTIDGEEGGVHINADFGFLSNCGSIFSTDGDAVDLAAGGYVSNMSSGTISGSLSAVAIADSAGTLVNKGLLTADDTVVEFTDGGTVSNRGDIEDGTVGVSISGGIGIVYNDGAGGSADYITGSAVGVLISGTIGTLENLGLIKQSGVANGDAAVVMAGGYIYNQASMCGHTSVIDGYRAGVIAYGTNAISINNQGVIEGTAGWEHGSDGVILGTFGGQIENGSTAMISAGFGDAILSHYGSFAVDNSGQIVAGEGDGIDSFIPYEGSFGTGTVSVNNSGLIHGESSGIYIDTGAGTIFNTDEITGQYQNGVYLGKGGTVFSGTLGLIAGGDNGIVIGNSFGSVTNFGAIHGYDGSGVEMYAGGDVNNWSWYNGESFEGTITGHYNGVFIGGGAGIVSNDGVITGAVDDGVWLNKGGTVFNGGYILGQYSGVRTGYAFETVANSGSLFNNGVIKGNTVAGVIMYGGGLVYNEGWILDTQVVGYGVAMYTPDSYVFNDDDIQVGREGQGVRFYNGGTLWNDGEIRAGLKGTGVYLRDGGAVYNSGYIYGGFGVRSGTMSAAYVSNEGEIIGHTVGVQLNNGGFVYNKSYYGCDGFYAGEIYGRQIGVQINGNNVASIANFGFIGGGVAQSYGIGVQLNDGGSVYNGSQSYNGTIASGMIEGGDVGVQVNGNRGYVWNTGTIRGGTVGVSLNDGGDLYNAVFTTFANCNLYSTAGTIIGGKDGVDLYATYRQGTSSITNAGLIAGGSGAGVYVWGDGGTNIDNKAGGTISGDYGVRTNVYEVSLGNHGLIAGNFAGVYADAEFATVSNDAGGVITGGSYGVEARAYGIQISNAGSIGGGSIGVYLNAPVFGYLSNVSGGVINGGSYGVYGDEADVLSVSNAGSIFGGAMGVRLNYSDYAGVTNLAGGTIIGADYAGIVMNDHNEAWVTNAGSIFGAGVGASLYDMNTGYVTNLAGGTIIGAGYAGVNLGNFYYGTVVNAGTIWGGAYGVVLAHYADVAYVNNEQNGVIGGNILGIDATAAYLSISNAGTIFGETGIYSGYASMVGITNLEGGTIAGLDGTGIAITTFGAASVFNSGTIWGAEDGVAMQNGDDATVSNYLGGTIVGAGNIGIYVHHTSAVGTTTITNAGGIWGELDGVNVEGGSFASVVNNEGGTIFGYYNGLVVDSGEISIDNAGLIASDEYSYDSGLSAYGDEIALENQASGTIVGYSFGAYLNDGQVSVDNAGLIEGWDGEGLAADDGTLAIVTNEATGTIYGADYAVDLENSANYLDNAGLITSPDGMAVYLDGSLASVINEATGTITGEDYGIYAETDVLSVVNSGLIGPGNYYDGIRADVDSGSVDNLAGGTISGGYTGIYEDAYYFSVVNAGLISAEYFDGIYAEVDSGSVDNLAGGTISGGSYGIYEDADAFSVVNAGLISAEYDGIYADVDSGSVDNLAGGTIAGGEDGIYADADNFSVQNSGLIQGGVEGKDYGIEIEASTFAGVLNAQTGIIVGAYTGVGIYDGTQGYVSNAGFIGGTYGVSMENVTNSLVNSATGTIIGSEGGVFLENGAQAINHGLIQGNTLFGVALFDGGLLLNSGSIIGGQTGVYSGYTSIGSSSIVVAGTVFNSGLISGGTTGVHLFNGGEVENAPGGVVTGGTYGLEIGYAGSTIANFGTVYNSGSISGGGTGVLLENGGAVNNTAGGAITGGTIGINALGLATIVNAGLITGGADGVDLASGGAVVNSGTIIGTSGTGLNLAGGSLVNSETGLIQGGTDGVIATSGANIVNAGRIYDDPAPGHAAVSLSGTVSLTNLPTGTISGEVGVLVSGNDATIVDEGSIISTDGGDAIQIEPGSDPVQITLTTGSSIAGAIDGGGTAGQITLTGQNTLDDTISNFGTGSALTVAPGASWTGAGNWTINNVNNTGTFQAGMLNVPLNLTGNFNNMGTLQVIVTPTTSTQFTVSGTATISGNLTYVFAPGTYIPGTTYNFLTAAGGVSGGFSGVSYVGATPYYVGKTTNVLITGNTLGSNLVLGRVAPLDDSVFADQNQLAAIEAQAANDELLGKAAGDTGADAAACAAAESVMPGHTSPRGTSTAAQMTGAVANAFCGAGGWIEATGSTANVDNSGDGFGYGANDAGFLAGIDRQVNGFGTKLGLAVGYDNAWLDDKAGGKATEDTVRVGLYGSQPLGAFTLAADIMYGHGSDTSTRETGVGAASGNFGSDIFNGGVQLDTDLDMQGLVLTPAGGVKFAAVNTGSFAETAPTELAPFKVDVDSSSYTSVQPFVNLGLSKIFTTDSQVTITPDVSVGYTLEAGDRGKSVNAVAPDGTVFGSGHTDLDEGGAQLAAGISAGKNNWALYANYTAFVSGNWTAQAGEAGLQIKF
jgi:hypothetical protein